LVNKASWDADERNKQNDLVRYLEALTRHQKQLIKGIVPKNVPLYLSLDEQDFHRQLEDSLTLNELSKLSKQEKRFRNRLIEDTMAVWRRNKEEIKESHKEVKQESEYYAEKHDKRWTPKHHEPQPLDRDNKIYSITEASRLHGGKGTSVVGTISGVQPLRKMVKGIQVKCLKCNTIYERKYDKPELFLSFIAIDRISKCTVCKTGLHLDHPKREDINAVIVELKDTETFSEIDPLRIIVFGDDEPAFDNTIGIERHVGETITVTGDIYPYCNRRYLSG
jgi:DNA replicative helicase MCM subunit Mcm2 (Cdc46/Mcm family)